MPLFVNKLLKLAVSVNLLCLLMVVAPGAVSTMVRPVRLYSDCSGRYIRLDMKGRVLADSDSSDRFQNLTITSKDVFDLKLTIYAEESQRYLCFNQRWKLVGSKNFRGSMCQFYEEMLETGYNRYRSVADESHYVGLNRKGRPLKGAAGKAAKRNKCLNFIKYNSYFNIAKHNDIVGRKSGSGHTSMNQSAIIADHLLRHHKLEGKRMKATTSTTTTLPPALLYPRLRHHHRAG